MNYHNPRLLDVTRLFLFNKINNLQKHCRSVLLCLFLGFPLLVSAQYSNEIVAGTAHQTYLVGSLPPDGVNNYAKLQIDILGGAWGSDNLGVSTYYVGNRSGLTIHQTTLGSGTGNYTLKAYTNPNGNTDIYVVVTADYPSFAVKSCMLQGNAAQLQTIVQQTPVGTDVTPAIVPVLVTDKDGNMGINTAPNASYKLAINGSGIATAFYVKALANWPDYVFDPAYSLPKLADIRSFIDRYHHLPGVPVAAEIQQTGIDLGGTTTLLTRKVEELTLYLIDKDRQLEAQKTVAEQQQKKLDDLQKELDELKLEIRTGKVTH